MRPVLVTGAAGFIGSRLCEALRVAGRPVLGVNSFSGQYPRAFKELNLEALGGDPGFTLHEGDLLELPLEQLTEEAEWVFHLAARPGVRDSWTDFDEYVHSNVRGTKAVLDACVGRELRLIYSSSSSVYGNAAQLPVTEDAPLEPISPYGSTKVMTEVMAGSYARAHGLDCVGLRYFTVYGPRQRPDMGIARFIEAARAGAEIPVYGDGRQKRDFTYVGDAVAATLAAAERGRPGAVYNIASSSPRPLIEVLDELGAALGCELPLAFEDPKLGDVRDTWADTSLAQAELGFSAATELRDGLRAQAEEADRRRSRLPGAAVGGGSV